MAYAVKRLEFEHHRFLKNENAACSWYNCTQHSDAKTIEPSLCRATRQGKERQSGIVLFSVIVDESSTQSAQAILRRYGDNSLEVEPLSRKRQSRIHIRMKAEAYGSAVHAILTEPSSAEIGQVVPVEAA